MRMIKQEIAQARSLLQQSSGICCFEEYSPLGNLILHLWNEDKEIREICALSLAGGTENEIYKPHYGHFATQLINTLKLEYPTKPDNAHDAYGKLGETLKRLLYRTVIDLKGLSNMHYSFLSGSLYLALLANCRDQIESIRRLGIHSAHYELCELLQTLQTVNLTARLNIHDAIVIQRLAAHALASFHPNQTPQLWKLMKSSLKSDFKAVQPVLDALNHPKSAPHLVDAMAIFASHHKVKLLTCLGRIGNEEVLPILNSLTQTSNRAVRSAAKCAIQKIIQKSQISPNQALLRPFINSKDEAGSLLRPKKSHDEGVDNDLLHLIITIDE